MTGAGQQAQAWHGETYIITNTDAGSGKFASRTLLTLHSDGTMAVVDSTQGGPTFFFSSQLGGWKPTGTGTAEGWTDDFNYPPAAGIGEVLWNFQFTGDKVSGTSTLIGLGLHGNPNKPLRGDD